MDLQNHEDVFPITEAEVSKSNPYASILKTKPIRNSNSSEYNPLNFDEEFLYTNEDQVNKLPNLIPIKKPIIFDRNTSQFNVSLMQAASNLMLDDSESEDELSIYLSKSFV